MVELRPVPHYAALIAVVRDHIAMLQIPYEEIEPGARLPDRYLGKILARPPMRIIHPYALFNLLDALGLKMHIVADPSAQVTLSTRRRRRVLSTAKHVVWHLSPDIFSQRGQRGGIKRAQNLSSTKRSRIARKAAQIRWADVKASAKGNVT